MQEEDLSRASPEPEAPATDAPRCADPAAPDQERENALCRSGDYPVKVAAVRKAIERRAAFGC
jgi:hypothetical protein